jgi:hypothetical protein
MITGNITISSKPREDDLSTGICGACLCECDEVGVDNSFDDAFGMCTNWGVGSDCCEADVFKGHIFLDKSSTHTARKDHKDGKVKVGQKYRQSIRKGYYIDDDGEHQGIFKITKRIIEE